MTKVEIIEKLKTLGIETTNAFPKTSFPKNGEICIGLFAREMNENFYFSNTYDGSIYKFATPETLENLDTEDFRGDTKYMVPLHLCEKIWEDIPYVEKPNKHFRDMSLREYACIHLRIPDSGTPWLDAIINQSKP